VTVTLCILHLKHSYFFKDRWLTLCSHRIRIRCRDMKVNRASLLTSPTWLQVQMSRTGSVHLALVVRGE